MNVSYMALGCTRYKHDIWMSQGLIKCSWMWQRHIGQGSNLIQALHRTPACPIPSTNTQLLAHTHETGTFTKHQHISYLQAFPHACYTTHKSCTYVCKSAGLVYTVTPSHCKGWGGRSQQCENLLTILGPITINAKLMVLKKIKTYYEKR